MDRLYWETCGYRAKPVTEGPRLTGERDKGPVVRNIATESPAKPNASSLPETQVVMRI